MATSPASATFDALPAPLLLYTMAETAGFKEGDLVGWKYRNALVLGHVKAIKRVNLELTPVNPEKQGTTVTRHYDKLIHERDIAKEDLEEAMRQGGHMSRAKMHEPPKPQAKRKGGAGKKAAAEAAEDEEAEEEAPTTPSKKAKPAAKHH